MNWNTRILVFTAFISVIATACVHMIPESTHVKTTNYLLTETPAELPPADSDFLNGAFFYVRPVELASYLGDSRIVSRTSPNKVSFSGNHRWGEPLEEGIGRVVGKNLSGLLGTLNYSAYPNRQKLRHDFEIGITIDRFERVAKDRVSLVGSWQLLKRKEQVFVGSLAETENIKSASKPGVDKIGEVAALSQVLRNVSERIATEIVRRLAQE